MDEAAMLALVLETDAAIDLGKQGVIHAHADIDAHLELGAPLTDQNGSARDDLTAKSLHAQALGIGIATIAG